MTKAMSMFRGSRLFSQGLGLTKFLAAGLPSFLLAIPLNYALVEWAHLPKPASYAVVLVFQVTLNFFMCRAFVFKDTNRKPLARQFVEFTSGILLFRVLDWAVYTAMVQWLGVYYLLAQCVNVFVFAIVKFKFSERVLTR